MRRKANHIRWLLCMLFVLAAKQTVYANNPPPWPSDPPKTIYVDADAAGANNGSSWADAYCCLQSALANARSGDEIRVARGIYKPDRRLGMGRFPRVVSSGDRTATFQLINNVFIKGGYAGFGEPYPDERKIYFYETILSGDLNGDDGPDFTNNSENSYHVVKVGGGIDAEALLDGFTITAGNADGPESFGGGMYIDSGGPCVIKCTIIGNTAIDGGGGIYCHDSSRPYIIDCTITQNSARNHGGGAFCKSKSTPTFSSCKINGNSADYGGGLYSDRGRLTVKNCTISGNTARQDGGAFYSAGVPSQIESNIIMGNSAQRSGGGIFFDTALRINNNLITDNSAMYGGGIYCLSTSYEMINNTIVRNLATGYGGGGIYCGNSSPSVVNTILWNNSPDEIYLKESSFTATCSDVQGGWPGIGNINADPLFVDADGADGVIGTEDDELSLLPGSPCNNAGDNSSVPHWLEADLDGNPRIMNDIVDIGAYEQTDTLTVYCVDTINGDDNNDGLAPEKAFATIQKGIDIAADGDVILVYPGLYQEEVNFLGKAITVQGVAVSPAGVPVIQNPGDFAVSFYSGEGLYSILKNFIIKNSFMGVFIVDGSPTISNLTIVGNRYGIDAYADSEPEISNTILWNNTDGDLFGCRAGNSCVERGSEGDITDNPLFVDPDSGDYHIRSERGRYWPQYDIWVLDKVTSPCIDAGDPKDDVLNEPMPHGGRINIGAYGGTVEASLSPWQTLPLPGQAIIYSPIDGEHIDEMSIILRWIPGENAELHDVYFGTHHDAVANATTKSTDIYRGRRPVEMTTYDPGILELYKTYYWRVDEVIEANPGNPQKGSVWSFTTVGFIILDDFEEYGDENKIWFSWHDGLGYGIPDTEPYFPANGTGAEVGDAALFDSCFMETVIVHGGRQSLPYFYDNNKQGYSNYSEATMTLDYPRDLGPRDWTEEGIEVLSLWFYGDPANTPESMYVALANVNGSTAVVYHTNPDAVLVNTWTEWTIELQEFAEKGVNLTDVDSITIGFGDRDNPQPGGSGKMYFDDIRLCRLLP